jgi:hypothetical protein
MGVVINAVFELDARFRRCQRLKAPAIAVEKRLPAYASAFQRP